MGQGGDVDSLQQAFVNSPSHYHNLVDPAFNLVGIGVVYGSGGMIFVTVDFMQRGGAAPSSRPRVRRRRGQHPHRPRLAHAAPAALPGPGARPRPRRRRPSPHRASGS